MSTEKRLMEEHLEIYHQSFDNMNGKLIERYNRQSSLDLSPNVLNAPAKSMTFSSAAGVNNTTVVPLSLSNSGQQHHSGLPINLLNAFNILQQGSVHRSQSNVSATNLTHSSSMSSAPVGIQCFLSPTSLSNATQCTTTKASKLEKATTTVNHSVSTVTTSFVSEFGSSLTNSTEFCPQSKGNCNESGGSPDETPGEESGESTSENSSICITTTPMGNMSNNLGGSICGVSGSRRRKATIPGRICLEASSIQTATIIDGIDSEEDREDRSQYDGSVGPVSDQTEADKSGGLGPPSPKRPCLVIGSPKPSLPGSAMFTVPASPSSIASTSLATDMLTSTMMIPLPTSVSATLAESLFSGQPDNATVCTAATCMNDQSCSTVNPTWLLTNQPAACMSAQKVPVVCASPSEATLHPSISTPASASAAINLGNASGSVIRLPEILELIRQLVMVNNTSGTSGLSPISTSASPSPVSIHLPIQLTNATQSPLLTMPNVSSPVTASSHHNQQQHQLYAVSSTASADAANTFRLVDIHANRSSTPSGGGLLLLQSGGVNTPATNCLLSTNNTVSQANLNSTSLASLVASLTGSTGTPAWVNSAPTPLPVSFQPLLSVAGTGCHQVSPAVTPCHPSAVGSSVVATRPAVAVPSITMTAAVASMLNNATKTTNSLTIGGLNAISGGSAHSVGCVPLQLSGHVTTNGGVDDQALDMSVRSQMTSVLNGSSANSMETIMEEHTSNGETKFTNKENRTNNNAVITMSGNNPSPDSTVVKLTESLCKPMSGIVSSGVGETAHQQHSTGTATSTGNYTIVIDLVNAALKSGGISIRQRLASPPATGVNNSDQQPTNNAEPRQTLIIGEVEGGAQQTKGFHTSVGETIVPEGDIVATPLPLETDTSTSTDSSMPETSQSQLLILGQLHAIISALANNASAVSIAGSSSLTTTTSTATAPSTATTISYGSSCVSVPGSNSFTTTLPCHLATSLANTVSQQQEQPSTIASTLSSVGLQLRPPIPGQQNQQRQQHLLVNLATSSAASQGGATNGMGATAPLPIPDAVANLLWPTINSLTSGVASASTNSTLPSVTTPSNTAAAVAAVAAAAQSMMSIPTHFSSPSVTGTAGQGIKSAALLTNPTLLANVPSSLNEGAQGAVNALNNLVPVSSNLSTQAATLFTGGNQAAIINLITNRGSSQHQSVPGITTLNAGETSRLLSSWTHLATQNSSESGISPPPAPPPTTSTSSNSVGDNTFPQLPLGVTVNNCLAPGGGILTTNGGTSGAAGAGGGTLNLFNPTHAALLAAAAASGVNGGIGPLNQITLSALRGNGSTGGGGISSASMMAGRLPLTAHQLVGSAGATSCPVIGLIDTSGAGGLPGSSAGGIQLRLATTGGDSAGLEENTSVTLAPGYPGSSSLLAPTIDLAIANGGGAGGSRTQNLDCAQDHIPSTYLFARSLDQLSVVGDSQQLPDLSNLNESTPTAGGPVSSGRRRRRQTQVRKPGDHGLSSATKSGSPSAYNSSAWDSAVMEDSYLLSSSCVANSNAAIICGTENTSLYANHEVEGGESLISGLLVKSDQTKSEGLSSSSLLGSTRDSPTTAGQQQSRPHRQNFTPTQNRILTEWYDFHQNKPYPSTDDTRELATKSGLTYSQVKKWFANKRARSTSNGLPRPTPPLAPDSSADPTAVEAVVANALAKANRSLHEPVGCSSGSSSSNSSCGRGGSSTGLSMQQQLQLKLNETMSASTTILVKPDTFMLSPGRANGTTSCRSSTAHSPSVSSSIQPEMEFEVAAAEAETAVTYTAHTYEENDDIEDAVSGTNDTLPLACGELPPTTATTTAVDKETPVSPRKETESDDQQQDEEEGASDGEQLVIHLPSGETPAVANSPTVTVASSPPTLEVHLNPRTVSTPPEPAGIYVNGTGEEHGAEEADSSPELDSGSQKEMFELGLTPRKSGKSDDDGDTDDIKTSGGGSQQYRVDEEDLASLQKSRSIRNRSINLRTS